MADRTEPTPVSWSTPRPWRSRSSPIAFATTSRCRRRWQASLKPAPTDSPAQVDVRQKALADAIRLARQRPSPATSSATPATQFREIIRQDARERSVRDIYAAMEEVPRQPPLKVNVAYPEQGGAGHGAAADSQPASAPAGRDRVPLHGQGSDPARHQREPDRRFHTRSRPHDSAVNHASSLSEACCLCDRRAAAGHRRRPSAGAGRPHSPTPGLRHLAPRRRRSGQPPRPGRLHRPEPAAAPPAGGD